MLFTLGPVYDCVQSYMALCILCETSISILSDDPAHPGTIGIFSYMYM